MRVSTTTTTKRDEPSKGITASQFGRVRGLDPDERIRRPERKPPFDVAALAKHPAKTIKEITTSRSPFAVSDVGMISRKASIAKDPVRP
jgi:hypothetical protein